MAKKVKQTLIKESLRTLDLGEHLFFLFTEVEESSVRSGVAKLHNSGTSRFETRKQSNGIRVSRVL